MASFIFDIQLLIDLPRTCCRQNTAGLCSRITLGGRDNSTFVGSPLVRLLQMDRTNALKS